MYFFVTEASITVIDPVTSNIHSFEPTNGLFPVLKRLIKENDEEKLKIVTSLFNNIMENKVKCNEKGVVTVLLKDSNKKVTFEDKDNTPLLNLIRLLRKHGIIISDIESIKPFLRNIAENKHINALEQVYRYCSNKDFEITEDGCILAYKAVNPDLTSIYDGKTKHTLNKYTEEKDFDTNYKNLCSKGLHFCSYEYLKKVYGDCSKKYKYLIVKVNPKDIVAIPSDYNNTKGRCSKYQVLKVLNFEDLKKFNEVSTEVMKKITPVVRTTRDKLRHSDINSLLILSWFNNNIESAAKYLGVSPETLKRIRRRYNSVKGLIGGDRIQRIPFPGEVESYIGQKKCTCPVVDNCHGYGRGRFGIENGWVINNNCPVHSWEE